MRAVGTICSKEVGGVGIGRSLLVGQYGLGLPSDDRKSQLRKVVVWECAYTK